ncbi:ATP-grasp domain-containing protein [Salicibibacter halophilus]|uniref:ATP-grasp domain-containing protein n=1 Tax=Salicibibacter halophilus TaxID=2502791 RepID=A0A514LIE0_9BACI|nr:ATP-grasp domain-containing protein [Salicibibacter halophilus]QDI91609.1 ATP-grasp domain-containing protein [Salicibibacter halophilus]
MEEVKEVKNKWLPHLIDAVPTAGQGKRISTYTVALEGWRRGITLKFYRIYDDEYKMKIRYSLSHNGTEHHFSLSMGDYNTDESFEICDDKQLTREYMEKAGVPVPKGKKFLADRSNEEIIDYANSLGYPLALKPVSANGGKGVFANVIDEEALRKALPYVREELEYPDVIIEEHVPGKREFRVIVLGDQVLGAMNRIPANIVGDGVSTIKQLIHMKNEIRKQNPTLQAE